MCTCKLQNESFLGEDTKTLNLYNLRQNTVIDYRVIPGKVIIIQLNKMNMMLNTEREENINISTTQSDKTNTIT